jgi:hypothetical protein
LAESVAITRKARAYEFGIVLWRRRIHCACHHIVAYVAGKGEKVTINLRWVPKPAADGFPFMRSSLARIAGRLSIKGK